MFKDLCKSNYGVFNLMFNYKNFILFFSLFLIASTPVFAQGGPVWFPAKEVEITHLKSDSITLQNDQTIDFNSNVHIRYNEQKDELEFVDIGSDEVIMSLANKTSGDTLTLFTGNLDLGGDSIVNVNRVGQANGSDTTLLVGRVDCPDPDQYLNSEGNCRTAKEISNTSDSFWTQDVATSDGDMGGFDITNVGQINTGQGLHELYAMDQDVQTSDAVTFSTVNTGQGDNELYAMNQDVTTSDNVEFNAMTLVNQITEFSTDENLTDNSDDAVPTEQAVKQYVNSENNAQTDNTIDTRTYSGDIPFTQINHSETIPIERLTLRSGESLDIHQIQFNAIKDTTVSTTISDLKIEVYNIDNGTVLYSQDGSDSTVQVDNPLVSADPASDQIGIRVENNSGGEYDVSGFITGIFKP